MDRYLQNNYLGKYRVKAEYDKSTNDFPRDYMGNIDDSFADFYIDCLNGIRITHVCPEPRKRDHYLALYIPKLSHAKKMIKAMAEYLDVLIDDNDRRNMESWLKLIQNKRKTFLNYEFTDEEFYGEFIPDDIEYIGKFIKIRTLGAKIQPLSPKNLPKSKSSIPDAEMKKYKKIMDKAPGTSLEKAAIVVAVNNIIIKDFKKGWELERRKLMLDMRNYIYYKGHWDKYISELQKKVEG